MTAPASGPAPEPAPAPGPAAGPAAAAAALWGGRPVRLVAARENAVHEMRLPGGGRAALRLHRRGYQGEAAIAAELAWCAALADRGLPVSRPLPARDGALLQRLPDGRAASAVAWIEGAPLGRQGAPLAGTPAAQAARFAALGRLLAELHRAGGAPAPAAPWPRPDWGVEGLAGAAPVWGRFWEHPAATPAEAAELRAIRAALHDRLAALAAAGADRGPIHADVMRENVLVTRDGGLALIDFDDCGTGFRLYDLGTALVQNLAEPAYPDLRDALVEGYGAGDAATVELFALARACASVGWTMPRLAPDDPTHRRHLARALDLARRLLG